MIMTPSGVLPAWPAQPGAPAAALGSPAFGWGWPWPWPWTPPFPAGPGTALGLNDTGFAYIPAACSQGGQRCRVHVVFHGCKQTVEDVQEQYARNTGYNRWAGGNRITVLYPQAKSEPQANPNGCWDWWGYTGSAYATKAGPQMAAVRAMLDRLAGR